VLFPCTCVLQPTLVPLYQTSSLFPSPLPIAAPASLRLPYSLLYRKGRKSYIFLNINFNHTFTLFLKLLVYLCRLVKFSLDGLINLYSP
jgi:hypothetical protein